MDSASGRCAGVELEGIDKVAFDLDIFTKYGHMVHKNSVAMLGSEGFIGQGVIVIVTDANPGPRSKRAIHSSSAASKAWSTWPRA